MRHIAEVRSDGLYLDGEKFFLISGDFHYFRTLPDGWKRRMELMRDFGLTAVTTYVAWNMHEPKPGTFCFEGIADLPRFLQTAADVGLKVILRCSPYMCAEWEMGGLPSWLLQDRNLCVRSSDPAFMEPLTSYFKVLAEKVRPYLYTNGGPIILVGLENEYGSFGDDKMYLCQLSALYRDNGLDVPYISANGSDPFKYINGTLPENWNGVDCSARPAGIGELKLLQAYQPDKPPMAGEAWCGSIMFWGKDFHLDGEIEANAEYLRQALDMGAAVNFYMFCGGTNFGFTSGALKTLGEEKRYTPLMTSYDYDAPVSEEGTPRKKYFAMRDVLDRYLGKEPRRHTFEGWRAQRIKSIALTEFASLLEQREILAETRVFKHKTVCMEDLNQDYGLICYTTKIAYTDPRLRYLYIDGLRDRACVYLNGTYIGSMMRDAEEPISFTVPEDGAELSILVENMGRVNYGYEIYDRKGIIGCVRIAIQQPNGTFLYNFANNMGFMTETLPLNDLKNIRYGSERPQKGLPVFCRGTFRAEAGVDTFLDMRGWNKGIVWINGFNLGRYWSVGPQQALYVPGEILKEENTLEILELHGTDKISTVQCLEYGILCEIACADDSLAGFELK